MNARQLKEAPLNLWNKTASQTKQAVSLRLVPEYSKPLRKWRTTMFVIPLMLLFSIVAGVFLNTLVAKNQYEITSLVAKERALKQETESLHSLVAYYQSPQVLNAKAKELGLVEAGSRGIVDMSTGEIIEADNNVAHLKHDYRDNIPLPKKPERFVPKSEISDRAKSTAPVTKEVVEKVTDPVKEKPVPTIIEVKPKTTKSTTITHGERPAEWSSKKLNGGSIPAPTLREPRP